MNFRVLACRLAPALALLTLASAVLLLSDLDRRKPRIGDRVKIALFQFSSRPTLVEACAGAVEGLREAGWGDGDRAEIRRFNSENDLPTASAIASQIADGPYRMVVTMSTVSLQVMANANRKGRVQHVFGCVTDPAGAGVGIERKDPSIHPSHLAGIGTFQPVEDVFRLVKTAQPRLQTVGTVWCPAEACSAACVEKARAVCAELGIKLVEKTVDGSVGVGEATRALASQGVEAIWVGGDNTVELAISQVIEPARQAGIPVFTNNPDHGPPGAVVNLGADYRELGRLTGHLAARILDGLDPASIRIENVVPRLLCVNRTLLPQMKPAWDLTSLAAQADIRIETDGTHRRKALPAPAALGKRWNVALIKFSESPSAEEGELGVKSGLLASGLVEGRDYRIQRHSAQGDMGLLSSVVDTVAAGDPDLVITLSTPTLQKAAKKITRAPVVFTFVADPITAGVGKSNTDHLPHVTGAYTLCDYAGMLALVKQLFPSTRRLGTLYAANEANAVFHRDNLERLARKQGYELVSLPVNTSSELTDATSALCSRGVEVLTQVMDNLTDMGFVGIANAARGRRIPLLAFSYRGAEHGALLSLARDYENEGYEAAGIAARVMRGEAPSSIPFMMLNKNILTLNLREARRMGLAIPDTLRRRAVRVIE